MRDDGILPSEGRYMGYEPEPMPAPKKKTGKQNLDSEENQRLLSRLREWFGQEWTRQAANRFQMALDEDYYDGLQWSDEDARAVQERGQAPLVYNEVKPTIDWVLGTERRTRIDYRVLAREPEGQPDAEVKTSLMKYLSDTNRTPFSRSRAFESAVKAGLGWLEIGLRGDPSEELIFHRVEDWRRILYDSNSTEADLGDARYIFRWKYLDEDVAKAYFPARTKLIEAACMGQDSVLSDEEQDGFYMGDRSPPDEDYQSNSGRFVPYDPIAFASTRRKRVRVMECWYKEPQKVRVFRDADMLGEVFDAANPEHVQHAREGFSLFDNIQMTVRCAIFVDTGMLFVGDSPFAHGRFPFVPVWCFRRARDNAPYGMIRGIRDPQDDLNKRSSKALWLLSVNRITMDEGAVEDIEDLRDEVSRPDAIIVKKAGKSLVVDRDIQLAQQHVQLMERNVQHIRNLGGVTSENLGRQSNATSGKAILARQEQGSVTTGQVFDNLRESVQLAGEIELSLIEQLYDEPKIVRIVGERKGAKYLHINQPDPETGELLNDITARHASFVVDEQDHRSSVRIAQFESLFDIITSLAQTTPEIAINMLDLLVEAADIPNRDEMVQRIRQLNGQRDPDEEVDPEQEAEAEQAMQAQAEQEQQLMQVTQELAMARAQAEIQKLQTEIGQIAANADKIGAEAVVKRVQAMYSALQSAQVAAMSPGSAQAADEILRGSGYVDPQQQAQQEQALQEQAMAEEQQMQEQQMQEQAMAEEQALQEQGMLEAATQGMPPGEPGGQPPPASAGTGMMQGIHTPDADGVR